MSNCEFKNYSKKLPSRAKRTTCMWLGYIFDGCGDCGGVCEGAPGGDLLGGGPLCDIAWTTPRFP